MTVMLKHKRSTKVNFFAHLHSNDIFKCFIFQMAAEIVRVEPQVMLFSVVK